MSRNAPLDTSLSWTQKTYILASRVFVGKDAVQVGRQIFKFTWATGLIKEHGELRELFGYIESIPTGLLRGA
jgi:hypothetical protein